MKRIFSIQLSLVSCCLYSFTLYSWNLVINMALQLKLWNSMHVKANNITSLVRFEQFQILVWEIAIYYKKYHLAENLAALFFYLAESSRISPSFQPNFPTSSWHHCSSADCWLLTMLRRSGCSTIFHLSKTSQGRVSFGPCKTREQILTSLTLLREETASNLLSRINT